MLVEWSGIGGVPQTVESEVVGGVGRAEKFR